MKPQFTPEVLSESIEIIQSSFRQFRPILLKRAGNTDYISKQNDGSPVTETDMEVEVSIQKTLARFYPTLPVFGEETGYGKDMPAAYWLIDPIDGTKAFIQGEPTFTCMAVLIQNNEATASIIYNPSTNDMYTAQLGKGAYKNNKPIRLGSLPLPRQAICKEIFISKLDAILRLAGVACKPSPTGGGFGFTMVLDGLAAARFNMQSGGYTHDYAPGGLLVREAGGVLLPILEDEYTFETRSFVACHPDLEPVLRPHLSQLRTLEQQSTT